LLRFWFGSEILFSGGVHSLQEGMNPRPLAIVKGRAFRRALVRKYSAIGKGRSKENKGGRNPKRRP